jgi:hypothetical protein
MSLPRSTEPLSTESTEQLSSLVPQSVNGSSNHRLGHVDSHDISHQAVLVDDDSGMFGQLVRLVASLIDHTRDQHQQQQQHDLNTSLLAADCNEDESLCSRPQSYGRNNSIDSHSTDFASVAVPPPLPCAHGLRERSSSTMYTARQIVRQMGDYLAYVTLFAMLILIPTVTYRALSNAGPDTSRPSFELAAFDSAGVMVIGTVIISLRLVYLHLTHWYMPTVQKYVVRILWMVPLYAIQSWFSLRFHNSRIYIDSVRDLYEAYVIASFVYYLIELLGGQDSLVQILEQKQPTQPELGRHVYPLNKMLNEWELGTDFMLQCKHGVLQYVVFKIVSTMLTFFFESIGIYHEGTFHWGAAYPYICFFQNMSVMYALYCLVMLYTAINEELRSPINWRPLGKFLCVKGVVFFTWWQGVIIYYLKAHGVIEHMGAWSSEDVANGLINYCIIIEMIAFALAHSYTFSYKEYLPSTNQQVMDDPNLFHYHPQHHYNENGQAGTYSQQHPHQHRHVRTNSHSTGPPSSAFLGFDPIAASDQTKDQNLSHVINFHQLPIHMASIAPDNNINEMMHDLHDGGDVPDSGSNVENDNFIRMNTNRLTPLSSSTTAITTTTKTTPPPTTFRSPTTLPEPMNFRDAFWSSTVPRETIQDIQQLRAGLLLGRGGSHGGRDDRGDVEASSATSLLGLVRLGSRDSTNSVNADSA